MEYTSVAETGAKPGESVVCVSVTEKNLEGVRYVPGLAYKVVGWFGRSCVEGQRHGKKCGAGEEKWIIPFDGFGAVWKIAK